MKVLNEKNAEKVLSLLDAQYATYSKMFDDAQEDALIQNACGMLTGARTVCNLIRRGIDEKGAFNEDYLDCIKLVADNEMYKANHPNGASEYCQVFWRSEYAVMMAAYVLIKDFMTEEGKAPISEEPKKNQDGLDDKGQKIIEDHLKKCEDRLWDKMNQCKESGKDVDPRDKGRAHGFHKGREYVRTYRHNIFGGMKAMTTQIELWNRNTCPAPFEHQSMLASAEALQEVLDLVNIYYTESLECLE